MRANCKTRERREWCGKQRQQGGSGILEEKRKNTKDVGCGGSEGTKQIRKNISIQSMESERDYKENKSSRW